MTRRFKWIDLGPEIGEKMNTVRIQTHFVIACTLIWICLGSMTSAQANTAVLSAVKSPDSVTIESRGGSLTYKAVIDAKNGGDIADLRLPADGNVVARELNDLFFLAEHGDQYTLRGWTGRSKFTTTCSVDLVLQKTDEIVVSVHLLSTGTFKILATDEPAKTNLRKAHVSYHEKTIDVKRIYTFKPDRIVVDDELLWLYPDMQFKTFYFTAAFVPTAAQSPVRMVNGGTMASLYGATSGGKKVPPGIAYPFTAENFLKNGYKVSLRSTATSFHLAKSDTYFYEKPWQQDWFQLSGFMYRLPTDPAVNSAKATHEIAFSKATPSEMPPIVTIQSPPWDARWLDEKGEVAKYKIGDTVKLSASAVNADGTPVPSSDFTWDIHIDPWWNTPAVTLHGSNLSYQLPDVTNEKDLATAKDRQLLCVIWLKTKGKNGTESIEPFTMLIDRRTK